MKTRWIFKLVLLISLHANSQNEIEHIQIQKTISEKDYLPRIDGYFNGKIPAKKLGDSQGIQTFNKWKVVSFTLNYPFGSKDKMVFLLGNQIPDSVIQEIYTHAINQMIFFTDIVAIDEDNQKRYLVPMNLIPFKNED
jgi:hypothetical protein